MTSTPKGQALAFSYTHSHSMRGLRPDSGVNGTGKMVLGRQGLVSN